MRLPVLTSAMLLPVRPGDFVLVELKSRGVELTRVLSSYALATLCPVLTKAMLLPGAPRRPGTTRYRPTRALRDL
eukprot:2604959-Rhodomonas_salina.2